MNTKYTEAFWLKPVIYHSILIVLPFHQENWCCMHFAHPSFQIVISQSACPLRVCVRKHEPLRFITNKKLWTTIKHGPAQELMVSNSLSRPSWDRFSGPSRLSGATWTSRDMWPQWLSLPSIWTQQSGLGRLEDRRPAPSSLLQPQSRRWLTDLCCWLYDKHMDTARIFCWVLLTHFFWIQ